MEEVERKEDYISDESIDKLIHQLQDGINAHYKTCDDCSMDTIFRRCTFCGQVTRLIFMQAAWITERERREVEQDEETAIRAHD